MDVMTNPFEGIRAVLFDLDGTLVETDIDFGLMKSEMLALGDREGIPASDLRDRDILTIVDIIACLVDRSAGPDAAHRVKREAYDKLEQIELANCDQAVPIAGSLELLNALRERCIGVGIVTRNCGSAVKITLAKTGITADVLLTRDDVLNTKPHPDHLLCALELLGAEPVEALMVGDHWMDVQGGRAAGTRTAGLLRDDRPENFFDREPPDFLIRSLSELTEQLMALDR